MKVFSRLFGLYLTSCSRTETCFLLKELVVWGLSYLYICYFFTLVTVPFYFYRRFIAILAKIQDKDITSILTGLSALFHRDFDILYNDKPLHAIVTCVRVKGGSLSASSLQHQFLQKVVLKKDSGKGRLLLYPELQQYFTRFLGYSFLKWDRHFDIKNHVRAYQRDAAKDMMVMTRTTLIKLWEELMVQPFSLERSPWEVILVENYLAEEDELEEMAPDWVIFVRMHHGLADGFSLQKMMSNLFDDDCKPDFKTGSPFSSFRQEDDRQGIIAAQRIQDMVGSLRCLVMGPYDLVNRWIRYGEPIHSLHFPAVAKSKLYFIVESDSIPVAEIKLVKNRLGVGFTAVLLTVMCGAVRRYLDKQGQPLPERYTITVPFPSQQRRDDDDARIGNDFFLTSVDLPIGLDSQQARLHQIQQNLDNLRYSSFQKMMKIFLQQISNMPSTFMREISKKSLFSATYSSIPGPDWAITTDLGGARSTLIDINFTHGLGSDSLGLAISSFTYAGKLRMTLFVDRNLMGGARERAEQLGACLMEEYRNMKDLGEGKQIAN